MRPWLDMAVNNAWANMTLHDALALVPAKVLTEEGPSFFGSILATLAHIAEVDRYYLDALEERARPYSEDRTPPPRDLDDVRAEQARLDARFVALTGSLTAERLERVLPTMRNEGVAPERVDALVLHLAQHQIHHRGQVHGMISAVGYAAPQLDDFHLAYGRVPSAVEIRRTLGDA